MVDPVRLISSPHASDLERRLLTSWDDERPSKSARAAIVAALVVTPSVETASRATGATAKSFAALKWFVAIVTATLLAAVLALRFRHSPSVQAPRVPASHVEVEELAAPVIAPIAETPIDVRPLPSPTSAKRTSRGSLADEIATIDRARRALEEGDEATTRSMVDAYEAKYPEGAFVQEADVLRIEALLAQDRLNEASERARSFLQTNPESPHGPRLRQLLDGASRR